MKQAGNMRGIRGIGVVYGFSGVGLIFEHKDDVYSCSIFEGSSYSFANRLIEVNPFPSCRGEGFLVHKIFELKQAIICRRCLEWSRISLEIRKCRTLKN